MVPMFASVGRGARTCAVDTAGRRALHHRAHRAIYVAGASSFAIARHPASRYFCCPFELGIAAPIVIIIQAFLDTGVP